MHFQNRFLLLLMLIPIVACSDAGDDGPALDTAAEPVETGSSDAIYLSDLDRSEPRSALSREWKHGAWRLVDYTAERDAGEIDILSIHDAFRQKPDPGRTFSGTLLLAMHDSRAPEITYSPDRAGWHRIYIGLYQKPFEGIKAVDVRLSRDGSFTTLEGHEGGKDHQENRLDEVYWKTADLTGQDIHFRQITFPRIRDAWVAFVKLAPLSEEQVREFEADRSNPEHKRLFVHIDPGSPTHRAPRRLSSPCWTRSAVGTWPASTGKRPWGTGSSTPPVSAGVRRRLTTTETIRKTPFTAVPTTRSRPGPAGLREDRGRTVGGGGGIRA